MTMKFIHDLRGRGAAQGESGGVCAAMCAYYIFLRSHGLDYWWWLETDEGRAAVQSAGVGPDLQSHYIQNILGNMRLVRAERPARLSRIGGQSRFRDVIRNLVLGEAPRDGDFIYFELLMGVPGPGRFVERGEDNRARIWHAVAVMREPKFRVMDPAIGEIQYDTADELARSLEARFRTRYRALLMNPERAISASFYDPLPYGDVRELLMVEGHRIKTDIKLRPYPPPPRPSTPYPPQYPRGGRRQRRQ